MLATEILDIYFPAILAFIVSRNVGKYNFLKYWQLYFLKYQQSHLLGILAAPVSFFLENGDECQQLYVPGMLTIITCRTSENMTFRNVNNYSFWKCWQLSFPDILPIITFRNASNHMFGNAGDRCQQLYFFKMITDVINYNFPKFQQLYFSEMLATNVGKYNLLTCWRF